VKPISFFFFIVFFLVFFLQPPFSPPHVPPCFSTRSLLPFLLTRARQCEIVFSDFFYRTSFPPKQFVFFLLCYSFSFISIFTPFEILSRWHLTTLGPFHFFGFLTLPVGDADGIDSLPFSALPLLPPCFPLLLSRIRYWASFVSKERVYSSPQA